MAELGVAYPALTPPPRSRPGMVVHSEFDVSGYGGTKAFDRYIEAGDDEVALAAALRDMPDATVTFYEAPEGEEFFDLASGEFLDHLARLDAEEAVTDE